MDLNIELLAKKAIEAKEHAYVPYSHFRVGAALLTADGNVGVLQGGYVSDHPGKGGRNI